MAPDGTLPRIRSPMARLYRNHPGSSRLPSSSPRCSRVVPLRAGRSGAGRSPGAARPQAGRARRQGQEELLRPRSRASLADRSAHREFAALHPRRPPPGRAREAQPSSRSSRTTSGSCASGSRDQSMRSRSGWSRSTRPTSRTRSPSSSKQTASTTRSGAMSTWSRSIARTRRSSAGSARSATTPAPRSSG